MHYHKNWYQIVGPFHTKLALGPNGKKPGFLLNKKCYRHSISLSY